MNYVRFKKYQVREALKKEIPRKLLYKDLSFASRMG